MGAMLAAGIVDDIRRRLHVVNTLASTIDSVNLQRASPEFLRVTARIGRREPE